VCVLNWQDGELEEGEVLDRWIPLSAVLGAPPAAPLLKQGSKGQHDGAIASWLSPTPSQNNSGGHQHNHPPPSSSSPSGRVSTPSVDPLGSASAVHLLPSGPQPGHHHHHRRPHPGPPPPAPFPQAISYASPPVATHHSTSHWP
jgi:hypothetical protein